MSSTDDIDRMVQEAEDYAAEDEDYAAEDKECREEVEVTNQAEALINAIEKNPEEFSNKIDATDKKAVQDTIKDLKAALEELQGEIADLKDKLLRTTAESENVRKRAEREKIDAKKFGISHFARDMMNVADNFQRALQSVTDEVRESGGTQVGNLIAGIHMTERELHTAFEKNGIVKLDPQPGEKFDPNFHQAVAEVPDGSLPNGAVVQVTQIGYLLEGRLLRPTMVLVAKNAADAPGGGEEGDGDAGDPDSKVSTTV